MAALLALASALSFGISDFTGGLASRRAPIVNVVLIVSSVSLLLAMIAVEFLPGLTDRLSRGALTAAICAGISFGGFFVLLAQTGPNGGA